MAKKAAPTQVYKVEFYFSQGAYGWSELWWYVSPNSIDNVFNSVAPMATIRQKMLASGAIMTYYMVSLQGVFRDSRQSHPVKPVTSPVKSMVAENVYTALLTRAQANSRYRRNLYFRGVPHGLTVPDDGSLRDSAAFWTAFGELSAYVFATDTAWSIQSVSKEPNEQGQNINAFGRGPAPWLSYTTISPTVAGVEIGSDIRIRQVRNAAVLNVPKSGVYKVMAQLGTSLVLGTPWLGDNAYTGGATAFLEKQLHYSNKLSLIPLRLTRRNAGVIHLQPKGRRKTVAR
jgi:hypothetical protein